MLCLVAQWCPTLSDPMDCSLPGSSVHGVFQARVLEWGAIAPQRTPKGWTSLEPYCFSPMHGILTSDSLFFPTLSMPQGGSHL